MRLTNLLYLMTIDINDEGGAVGEIQRVGDLEIDIDEQFERRQWRTERIGWVIMALIILAALLGLLGGSGALSSTTAGSGSLAVRYSGLAHMLDPTMLEVRVNPVAGQERLQVWLSQSFLDNAQVESILPEPDSAEVGDDRLIFSFALADSAREARIVFHLKPELPGLRQGVLGLEDGQSVDLSQFVYP